MQILHHVSFLYLTNTESRLHPCVLWTPTHRYISASHLLSTLCLKKKKAHQVQFVLPINSQVYTLSIIYQGPHL